MQISTKHSNARQAACRIPALQASLALLEADNPGPARIDFYGDPVATPPGSAPSGGVVVSVALAATAGTIDNALHQIHLTVPLEGQVTGAAVGGTVITWARVIDGDGDWWSDASVSDTSGNGDIKLQLTTLYNGAYCRITSAIFQG